MWKVVYIASNKSNAQAISERLQAEDILVRLGMGGLEIDELGASMIEILVSESEVEDALEIINEFLGLRV